MKEAPRILLVYYKPRRDLLIKEIIGKAILDINKNAQVKILYGFEWPYFALSALKFRPDVILTGPFGAVNMSVVYYFIKFLARCKLVLLTDEGVTSDMQGHAVELAAGRDRYGKYLVDYHLFWGEAMAKTVGQEIVRQGKLSSFERTKYFGYPKLQSTLNADNFNCEQLPERISKKLSIYQKGKIILFVTGFSIAKYTRETFVLAGDVDLQKHGALFLDGVESTKEFRREWVENFMISAEKNPDVLFVHKNHPAEQYEDYAMIEKYKNVLYVHEDVSLRELMKHAGLFVHYGSTAVADAYVVGVPSVLVRFRKEIPWYSDDLCRDSIKIQPNDIPRIATDFLNGKIQFEITSEIERTMKNFYNFEFGKPYNPAKKVAELLLDDERPQSLSVFDRYLWRALVFQCYIYSRVFFGQVIRRIQKIVLSGKCKR